MRTKKSSSRILTQLTGRRLQRGNWSCATRFAKRKRPEILRTWRNWRSNSPLKSRVCGKIARRRKKNCGLASENSRPRLLWQTGFRACRFGATCQRHVCHDRRAACLPLRQIRIEKAEHVRALAQFLPNRSNIISEETEKHVAPRIFGFAVMAVLINRNPIDGLAVLIGPIGVAFVMLHVDGIVVGLRKTTRDRLHDSKKPIEERRPEEWIVDEVMSDAVDVCVHH